MGVPIVHLTLCGLADRPRTKHFMAASTSAVSNAARARHLAVRAYNCRCGRDGEENALNPLGTSGIQYHIRQHDQMSACAPSGPVYQSGVARFRYNTRWRTHYAQLVWTHTWHNLVLYAAGAHTQ